MSQIVSQFEKASFQLLGVKHNDTLSQRQNKGLATSRAVLAVEYSWGRCTSIILQEEAVRHRNVLIKV